MLSRRKLDYITQFRLLYFKKSLTLNEARKLFLIVPEQIRNLDIFRIGSEEIIIDHRTETTKNFYYNVKPIGNNFSHYCYVCPACGKIHYRGRGNANLEFIKPFNFKFGKDFHEYFVPPCIPSDWELDLLPESVEGEYPNFIHIIDNGINTIRLPYQYTVASADFYGW